MLNNGFKKTNEKCKLAFKLQLNCSNAVGCNCKRYDTPSHKIPSRNSHVKTNIFNGVECGYIVAVMGFMWLLQGLCPVIFGDNCLAWLLWVDLIHSEQRPKNMYSQEEINLYCIIKLATEISLFSLQISKT